MQISTNQQAYLRDLLEKNLSEARVEVETMERELASKTAECDGLDNMAKYLQDREEQAAIDFKQQISILNHQIEDKAELVHQHEDEAALLRHEKSELKNRNHTLRIVIARQNAQMEDLRRRLARKDTLQRTTTRRRKRVRALGDNHKRAG